MSLNKFYLATGPNGEHGLRCDCGNVEYLTATKESYENFGYWKSSTTGKFEGHCSKCHSPVQPITSSSSS